MKKITLISLILFSLIGDIKSQVLASKIIEDKVILGPKNITNNWEEVASLYIDEIILFKEALNEVLLENEAIFNRLNEKKKGQKKKQKIKEIIIQIRKELKASDLVQKDWESIANVKETLIKISKAIESGACLEIVTKDGVYQSEQIEIRTKSYNSPIGYYELIPIEQILDEEKWVKRKEENCLSADPNDCLVWCLIKAPGGYSFIDISNDTQSRSECLKGFKLDSDRKLLSKQKIFNEELLPIQVLRIKNKKNNKTLSVLNWKVINC